MTALRPRYFHLFLKKPPVHTDQYYNVKYSTSIGGLARRRVPPQHALHTTLLYNHVGLWRLYPLWFLGAAFIDTLKKKKKHHPPKFSSSPRTQQRPESQHKNCTQPPVVIIWAPQLSARPLFVHAADKSCAFARLNEDCGVAYTRPAIDSARTGDAPDLRLSCRQQFRNHSVFYLDARFSTACSTIAAHVIKLSPEKCSARQRARITISFIYHTR